MNTITRKVLKLYRKYGLNIYYHMKKYKETNSIPDFELAIENYKYYIFLRDIIRTKKIEMFCL